MPVTSPARIAAEALANPRAFCALMSLVATYNAPYVWSGSAFRSHPYGLIVGTVKLTSHHHVDQLCDICITDGSGWSVAEICRDPAVRGDPHPKPIEGAPLEVWRNGRWLDAQYAEALSTRVMEILIDAASFVGRAQAAEAARREAIAAAAAKQREALSATAIAKALGSRA